MRAAATPQLCHTCCSLLRDSAAVISNHCDPHTPALHKPFASAIARFAKGKWLALHAISRQAVA
jgi:hypothetical protein